MCTEERDVVGFEGEYMVASDGVIFSLKRSVRRVNRQSMNRYGYMQIGLSNHGKRKNYSVHQLVAQAFIPNPGCKKFVNHIDGDKANNNVTNLEWVTALENIHHAMRIGKFRFRPVSQYDRDGNVIAVHKSVSEASLKTGISSGGITSVCNGVNKTAGGFIWRDAGSPLTEQALTTTNTSSSTRAVLQMSIDGEVIKRYPSIALAAKDNGLKRSAVGHACRGYNASSGGYKWSFAENYPHECMQPVWKIKQYFTKVTQ